MAAKMPELSLTCDICDFEGLNEESMRSHMASNHAEKPGSCPICDFTDISPDGLLVHVNTAHLEFSSPTDEELAITSPIRPRPPLEFDTKSPRPPLEFDTKSSDELKPDSYPSKNLTFNNNDFKISNKNNDDKIGVPKPTLCGVGAEGSPLRSKLSLNLRRNSPSPTIERYLLRCKMCDFSSISTLILEEHINRKHLEVEEEEDDTPVITPPEPFACQEFKCPLCDRCFSHSEDLEFHVNSEHRDILSPGKPSTPGSLDTFGEGCPVCCRTDFKDSDEMAAHVDDHFNDGSPTTPDLSSDRMLAKEIEKREKESRKQREQREFELLRAQYGMNEHGSFKEQSLTNMQKAVYAGEMSVSDFYERQIELKEAESSGVDDGSSCTRDLIPRIRAASQSCSNIIKLFTCTTVDHYASTYGDKGWGCGYRNLQMLLSSLSYHNGYSERLFKPNSMGGSLYNTDNGLLPRFATPSISRLQEYIETAWAQGFDVQGCDQLGGKLQNTRKWIGATEIVTVLSSLRIRCQLIDFDRPTTPDGMHPSLFQWVMAYFEKREDFKPPLYIQHQGHSRTIVGAEQHKQGHINLLLFDPSHSPRQMRYLKNPNTSIAGMRLVRRALSVMRARQYQLVAVRGLMETEKEYQESKVLQSIRNPMDE